MFDLVGYKIVLLYYRARLHNQPKGKSAAKLCDMRIIAFPRVPQSCNLGCPPTCLISPKRTKNEGMSSCRNAGVRFVQENGANNVSNCACFGFKP